MVKEECNYFFFHKEKKKATVLMLCVLQVDSNIFSETNEETQFLAKVTFFNLEEMKGSRETLLAEPSFFEICRN